MSDILLDLSADHLVTAIEENLFSLFAVYRKWPRAEVHEEAAIKWSMTDIHFPLFNSIMRAQLVPESMDVMIQSVIAQGKARNIPLLWLTGPATQPQDLGVYLETYGFINEGQQSGMAVDLANLNENLPAPAGFTIQAVNDDETLMQWCKTCVKGFGLPDFVSDSFYDLLHYADADTFLTYIGLLGTQPVATSLLSLSAGVAGIYNVATIPNARRRGIGALMTLAPLGEARMRGYKAAILHASDMGLNLYRSLGFKEYCKIGQYLWFPKQQQGAA
jgi:ribosomal protein S18 acetylase RimI-like enzyme